MLTSFGLFAFGVLALFSLSSLLAAARFRVSRRSILLRLVELIGMLVGTGWLAWQDHLGTLTAVAAWSAVGGALLVLLATSLLSRPRRQHPLGGKAS